MKLNLSQRTVKFHVSALLVKFEVAGRMGLMRKATDVLLAVKVPTGVDTTRLGAGEEHGVGQELRISKA
jgi:regulatory LuxR family protein